MPRPNLVVVRAGDASLHRAWPACSGSRSWDLLVSSYADKPYEPSADETAITVKGGKLVGLRETFERLPGFLDRYDYIWLPDDDIQTDCATIERLFRIMREEKLLLAQPSLTLNSHFSWVHTLNCTPLRLRYANHVEMMVPCFDGRYLREVLPHFPATIAGWGIDQVWCRLGEDNYRKCAIIDAVSVRHTRPPGNLARLAKQFGEDSIEEASALRRSFGLFESDPIVCCYEGKCLARGPILGRSAVARLMYLSYCARAWRNPRPRHVERMVRRYILQSRAMPNLSQLTLQSPSSSCGASWTPS